MKKEDQAEIAAVAAGYDSAGDDYFRFYRSSVPNVVWRYERLFIDGVIGTRRVLELGCGNGLPFTSNLVKRFDVTAVDVSQQQVNKARRNVPSGKFVCADMSMLKLPENSFDGVIALYSIIHLPRSLQPELIASIYSWLRPGGLFVATFGATEEDHREDNWFGVPMYWSSFDAETNRTMVSDAGFVVESANVEMIDNLGDGGEKETHQWIVARKPEQHES